jgi:N-acetylmuramoyl-L-alanine amidase
MPIGPAPIIRTSVFSIGEAYPGDRRISACTSPRERRYPAQRMFRTCLMLLCTALLSGCAGTRVGERVPRRGDEIMIAGQLYHTGAPVVLWTDAGGYDGYRVERRFVPGDQASWEASKGALESPNRYDTRRRGLSEAELERVRGGGWDLPTLQRVVDQFVIHYDVCGTSRTCFRVLHDQRGLSVHFLVDIDGTIYQTLDVKERAWHATTSNHRSVGIEIANIGAYPPDKAQILERWYGKGDDGRVRITLPGHLGDGGVRTPGFVGRPARSEPVAGEIQGQRLIQYDLTPQQYDSLIRLTATLCTVLPEIRCDYPRDPSRRLITTKLPDAELESYRGLIGHYHIQANKIDPGPAFDWDRVVKGAQRLMGTPSRP